MKKISVCLFLLCCLTFSQLNLMQAMAGNFSEEVKVSIAINKDTPMEVFGASKIEAALQNLKIKPRVVDNYATTGKE